MDRRLLGAWGASVGVVIAPFWGILAGRETAIYGDLRDHHLANTAWSAGRWLSGRLPDWGGWAFAGQNVIGAGQSAPFSPLSLLFGVLPTRVAFTSWLLLHLVLATTGAFVWSWRTWSSRPGAAVSAIAYGLNGFLVMHLLHMNLVLACAWMPWCLFGLDLLRERWSSSRLLACVVPLAMIGVGGHPQAMWIALVGVGGYGTVCLIGRRPDLHAAGRVLIGMTLGIGVAAVALVPQARFAQTSIRDTPTVEQAFTYATRPEHLATTALPGVLGGTHDVPGATGDWRGRVAQQEAATHVGIGVLGLAGIGAVMRRRDRRATALVVLTLFAVGTAVAETSPLARLVYDIVPFASSFRAWSRNLLLMNLAAALLAGAGVAALSDLTATQRRRLVVGAALATIVLVNVVAITRLDGTAVAGTALLAALALPVVVLCGTLWSVWSWDRRRSFAAMVLVVATSLGSFAFAYGAPWRHEGLPRSEADQLLDGSGLEAVDVAGGIDRWVTNSVDLLPSATVADSAVVNGYDPLLQKNYAAVTGLGASGAPLDERLWSSGWFPDVLRITTARLSDAAPSDGDWTVFDAPPDSLLVDYMRVPRLPDAYLSGSVAPMSVHEAPRVLLDPAVDLRRTTYVEATQIDTVSHLLDTPTRPNTVVHGTISDDGRASFTVDAERDALLVVSIAWLDGWKATVDGERVDVVRANGLVLGVPVPEGRHEVTFHFDTPGLHLGAWISLSALLVTAALAAVTSVLTSRRRGSGRRPSRRS